MYCRKCGSEIDDDSIFCSFCGVKLKESSEKTEKKEKAAPVQIVNSELYQILEAKEEAMPRSLTKRTVISKEWWKDEISIYSNALFFCKSNFAVEDVKQAFLEYYAHKHYCRNEILEENIPECFKAAIKLALRDFKNKNNGDFYFASVKEERKYGRNLNCIIQIEEKSYKYIVGVGYPPFYRH